MKGLSTIASIVLILLLASVSKSVAATTVASENDEYTDKYETYMEAGRLLPYAPVNTAAMRSRVEFECVAGADFVASKGDQIKGLSFKGVNNGGEQVRHLSVWACGTDRYIQRFFTDEESLTKVFDGDCTIAEGGTQESPQDILSIEFDTPFTLDGPKLVRFVVLCEDDNPGAEVLFLQGVKTGLECICTSGSDVSAMTWPTKTDRPYTVFHIATKLRHVTGRVTDENGQGIEGAVVEMGRYYEQSRPFRAVTATDGSYSLPFVKEDSYYAMDVTAAGHTLWNGVVTISDEDPQTKDFTLYSSVTYKAGKRSTIILPVAPDPSVGRYYEYVRREDKTFFFYLVEQPRANTPYILFADRDYTVDLSGMDLTIQPGRVLADQVQFIGSYSNGIGFYANDVEYYPDEESFTGTAMHAYLYGDFSILLDMTPSQLVFIDEPAPAAPDVPYHAMLFNRKTWRVDMVPESLSRSSYLNSTAVVDGKEYYIMETSCYVQQGSTYTNWREEDRKVYAVNSSTGEECLMYDFTLTPGEEVTVAGGTSMHCNSVDTIRANGTYFRRFNMSRSDDATIVIPWVEGVGSPYNVDQPCGVAGQPTVKYFVCTENDIAIFSQQDFSAPAISFSPTSIVSPRNHQVTDVQHRRATTLFDLQGRRLTTIPAKGLYIQNGRKRVVK